eukprot:Plantae.Rhodophyta-Purpureofilum_apyrenoidigerum.ctg2495.p2 GENE.Plantae.Rhodophyta-Purpureofilum_apyrenoidigerum.ctg2495~~Plantae.Rhodophyta-Purpureofilum_apyrenoidigerum.ctg2495.p2  ORF type:complete len:137 (-),score=42.31 Plantae.Rhodophyta-Purpureofilum_apyrenoidigerum.ctg2495:1052-1462(-)
MEFKTFVEAGRVAQIVRGGPNYGKLVVIVDVLDQNKCLIDGPCTGVSRQLIPFKQIRLTGIKLPVKRGAKTGIVKKHFEAENAVEKFGKTGWGKKMDMRAKRAMLTDYERFKVMVLRKKKAAAINSKYRELKKSQS